MTLSYKCAFQFETDNPTAATKEEKKKIEKQRQATKG